MLINGICPLILILSVRRARTRPTSFARNFSHVELSAVTDHDSRFAAFRAREHEVKSRIDVLGDPTLEHKREPTQKPLDALGPKTAAHTPDRLVRKPFLDVSFRI